MVRVKQVKLVVLVAGPATLSAEGHDVDANTALLGVPPSPDAPAAPTATLSAVPTADDRGEELGAGRHGHAKATKALDPHRDARHSLDTMLHALITAGGSDLHLTARSEPRIRVHGELAPLPGYTPLDPQETALLVRCLLSDEQWARFERDLEIDLAYDLPGLSRFRVNCFQQRDAYGAVLRAIPHVIKPLHELGIPEQIARFARLPRGLVLVTGPTGSGKTTTLASLLDLANRERRDHIVTIEDPIEFLHQHNRCLVNQREVGVDTSGFAEALKRVLRQDPDIILVGELRDLETVSTALTAAETGHLVLATLHTQSAAQTIDRVIDIFPPHQQQEIRAQLSTALQGIVTQALVKRADGQGRTVVCEIMVATAAIRNLIREGKNHQIPSFMQSSGASGMLTFDQDLARQVNEGTISDEQGRALCHSVEEYNRLAGHGGHR
jgi:twitching motility protein PilT